MKTIFVEAKRKITELSLNNIDFSTLPAKIFLAYSIQYKNLAEKIKDKLNGRIVEYRQVLGCSKLKSRYPILLVGSGKFHALNLALQDNTVYMLEGAKIAKLNEEEINNLKTKRKTALSRFLSSDNIGILVSLKPGQENFKKALILRKKLEKKGKKTQIFLADSINIEELDNFPIDSWINTACQALSFDSRIINLHEIP